MLTCNTQLAVTQSREKIMRSATSMLIQLSLRYQPQPTAACIADFAHHHLLLKKQLEALYLTTSSSQCDVSRERPEPHPVAPAFYKITQEARSSTQYKAYISNSTAVSIAHSTAISHSTIRTGYQTSPNNLPQPLTSPSQSSPPPPSHSAYASPNPPPSRPR
jgi:hypothetical protein